MSDEQTIDVLGLAGTQERGWRVRRDKRELELQALPTERLRENVVAFLARVSQTVLSAPEAIGDFALTEVTIKAEVTATGTVSLLGTGVEAGGTGGITFTFSRPATSPPG